MSRGAKDEASSDETSERVREVLRERGFSLRELGRRAGLGEEYTVKLVGRGLSRAGSANVLKLADALGVHYRWLVAGEGPRDVARAGEGYQVVYDERYPNRETALRPIERDLHPKTAARVRSTSFASNRDLSVLEWTKHILAEDERVRFEDEHPMEHAREVTRAEDVAGARDPKLRPMPAKWPGGRRPRAKK